MTCPRCGAALMPGARFCTGCGMDLGLPAAMANEPLAAELPMGQDAGMRLLLPVGRSVWAIVAGYLGLFAVLIVPAPLALIIGIIALRDIARHPDRHGAGRAWFGIVMGALGTCFLLFVIFAITFG